MSDRFDAKEVAIIWSENDKGKITDVMISYPGYILPEEGHYWNSSGVTHLGWMDGADPRMTPEGVFADMMATGFADNYWLFGALAQFSLIEQCAWARTMRDALKRFMR